MVVFHTNQSKKIMHLKKTPGVNNSARILLNLIILCTVLSTISSYSQQSINAVSRAERYIECNRNSHKRKLQDGSELLITFQDTTQLRTIKGRIFVLNDSSIIATYKLPEYIQNTKNCKEWTGRYLSLIHIYAYIYR